MTPQDIGLHRRNTPQDREVPTGTPGRFRGRTLLLSILNQGGIQNGELVFSNINEYGQASLGEMENPGIFKLYVIKALGWTKTHRQDLDPVVNQT